MRQGRATGVRAAVVAILAVIPVASACSGGDAGAATPSPAQPNASIVTDSWENPTSVCATGTGDPDMSTGATLLWDDGIGVTVGSPARGEPTSEGLIPLRFPVMVVNEGDEDEPVTVDLNEVRVSLAYGPDHREAVLDREESTIPEGRLGIGESIEYEITFLVANTTKLRFSWSYGSEHGVCISAVV